MKEAKRRINIDEIKRLGLKLELEELDATIEMYKLVADMILDRNKRAVQYREFLLELIEKRNK